MSFKILFVEDSLHKAEKIIEFINSVQLGVNVHHVMSFNSGSRALETDTYHLILMDLSLPTYDKSDTESGGRFRTFGGVEIARKAFRRKVDTKIIFITQYGSFSDRGISYSFEGFKEELKKDKKINFGGMILYSSGNDSWKGLLSKGLREALIEGTVSR